MAAATPACVTKPWKTWLRFQTYGGVSQHLLGPSILHRLNFKLPTPQKIIVVVAYFQAYHTVKNGRRAMLDIAVSERRFAPVVKVFESVCHECFTKYAGILIRASISASSSTLDIDLVPDHADLD